MRFEVYRSLRGGAVVPSWYWRLRAKNGRIIADGSEGYSSRRKALHAVERVRLGAADAPIKALD